MIPGDPSAWQIGIPILLAVLVIGVLILRRDRRPLTIGLVVSAVLLVIVTTALRAKFASPAMDMSTMQSASGVAPIPVTTTVLRDAQGSREVRAPGTVAPYLTQDIVARVSGLLVGLSIYTGDRVHAGDVIARLDEPELQSDASAAQAQARSAESGVAASMQAASAMSADVNAKRAQNLYWSKELVRERTLFEQGAVSAQDYQNERAQAVSARAAFDAARNNAGAAQAQAQAAEQGASAARSLAQSRGVMAGYASVIVPQDGIVVKRQVDPGAYVTTGTTIARIATIDRLRVQAQVAQQDLGGIAIGTPLDATLDSGRTIRGRVTSVSPLVDSATHTATVEAIVSNVDGLYEPGGYAQVVVHSRVQAQGNAFAIPSTAIIGGLHPAVWTIANGVARRHTIDVLSDNGAQARIRGDLRVGMHIVVDGASNLEDGDAVTEVTP